MKALILILGYLLQQAPPDISKEEYRQRRERLMDRLQSVAIVDAGKLLAGEAGLDANTSTFDFKYLAGVHCDGSYLVLVPEDRREILFINTGEDLRTLRAVTGIQHIFRAEKFDAFARAVLGGNGRVMLKDRSKVPSMISDGVTFDRGLGREITRLREVKSDAEMALIRKASEATCKAHLAAMKACRPGMNEKELQEAIEKTFTEEGCDGLAFPSIVGSGTNGTILHYMKNDQPMPERSLVVCDIGSSRHGYATDITRTLPTSGKFTEAQRKAYQCVLDAQRAAEALLKPGATFDILEQAARKVFREREMTKWSYCFSKDSSVRHGLGHYVGLSVHDSGTRAPFELGTVITIEPGWYDKDEGWGIRIEDIYLVTKDGFERLSAAAPREIDEIEKRMAVNR